jgi:WD40 repeat protein
MFQPETCWCLRRLVQLFVLALVCQGGSAQELRFQVGHTNDILNVKFSPDDSKLISYSAGDGWLCYWDVTTGQLLWKSKTEFIRKAEERANLEQFGWNKDQSLVYSRSRNGAFQTWDANSGRILSVSEANPAERAFGESGNKISVRKDYENFYLTNSETNQRSTIKVFSRIGSAYAVSHDGRRFAEGGSWGNAVIRITTIGNPSSFYEMKGGRIAPYVRSELETKLLEQQRLREAELSAARARRDKRAAVDTEEFKKQVSISFDHYGEMTDLGEQRIVESGVPSKSKVRKSREDANAIWLRLHNDSQLPIQIPTQSMYLPNPKCFFEFSAGNKILGLCDDREISIWFGLDDKSGKSIPYGYGFDFGSSAILLPKTSVLFAVPRAVLEKGRAIRLDYTFQAETDDRKNGDYGTPKTMRFKEADLPKTH